MGTNLPRKAGTRGQTGGRLTTSRRVGILQDTLTVVQAVLATCTTKQVKTAHQVAKYSPDARFSTLESVQRHEDGEATDFTPVRTQTSSVNITMPVDAAVDR